MNTLPSKRCRECGIDFAPVRASAIYCSRRCKQRMGKRSARRRAGVIPKKVLNTEAWTPEQWRAYHADWYSHHREARIAAASQWGAAHPTHQQANRVQYVYDMSKAEYARMLAEQDNRCKLCRRPFEPFKINRTASAHVDHSHTCPNRQNHKCKTDGGGCAECVRGAVCHQCNTIVIRFLELYPDRQTAAEHAYMADRPLLRYRAESSA